MATDFTIDENGNIACNGFLNPLGSESEPSYTFTGDANTGMWSPGANVLAFSTDGANRLEIRATGGVGIGQTNPGNRLIVVDGATGVGQSCVLIQSASIASATNYALNVSCEGVSANTNVGAIISATGGGLNYGILVTGGTSGFGSDATAPTALVHIGESTTARANLRMIAGAAPTTPNSGDAWHDSTRKATQLFVDAIKQTIAGVTFTSTADATVQNSTTEATILGTGVGTITLPANFWVAGKTMRITVRGVLSTAAVPGTLQIRARIGGVAGTVVLDSAANTPTAALSLRGFEVSGVITCRTTGAAGTVYAQGYFAQALTATTFTEWDMENNATVTIDTTAAAQDIQVTAKWNTADADNIIKGTNVMLEVLN